MKIELGKYYRTRDGRKLRIICVDAPKGQPVISMDEAAYTFRHNADGSWHDIGAQAKLDLIAPWIDKPVVDWGKMPAWAKWVACSDLGNWSWFSAKPSMENGFVNLGSGYSGSIPPEYAPKWTGDWCESLVERPTV